MWGTRGGPLPRILPVHPLFGLPAPAAEGSAAVVVRHHDQRVALLVDRCEDPAKIGEIFLKAISLRSAR